MSGIAYRAAPRGRSPSRTRTPCSARCRTRSSPGPVDGPSRPRAVSIQPLPQHAAPDRRRTLKHETLTWPPGSTNGKYAGVEADRARARRTAPCRGLQGALEIGERDALVHRQAPRADGRRAVCVASGVSRRNTRPGSHDVHGRRLGLHRADLHGARLRAQAAARDARARSRTACPSWCAQGGRAGC